jgi:magnesium transporter
LQKSIICYNDHEVKEGNKEEKISKDVIKNGYKLWIDITNFNSSDLHDLQEIFNLEVDTIEKVENNSKKPQIMISNNNQKFTVLLELRYKNLENLEIYPVYFFVGNGWLITLHSENVDLVSKGRRMFLKNNKIINYSIDALYYSIITTIIETYEQLVTAIELKILDFEKEASRIPSRNILNQLDLVSKQSIIVRRHFWQARDIINYLNKMEEDKEDIKFLGIVYDSINQLIDMVESYRETINSTREVFSSSISLQTNETMKILTIFSTIILPLSLILGIFSLQGFDLNNITIVPKDFDLLLVVMVTITSISLFFFWKKKWILSKDTKINYNNDDSNSNRSNKKEKK